MFGKNRSETDSSPVSLTVRGRWSDWPCDCWEVICLMTSCWPRGLQGLQGPFSWSLTRQTKLSVRQRHQSQTSGTSADRAADLQGRVWPESWADSFKNGLNDFVQKKRRWTKNKSKKTVMCLSAGLNSAKWYLWAVHTPGRNYHHTSETEKCSLFTQT